MAKTINGEAQIHAKVDGKKIIVTESSVRRDLQLANEKDEVVHKKRGDRLVRATTTASSLEEEQNSGNIIKTRSKATPNESSFLGTTSGGGPGCQETIRDTIAQTRFERVSKLSNDSLLAIGNTLQSDEDRLKFQELMALCTTLQTRVLDLEKTKTTQQMEINSLKIKVKKLEKRNRDEQDLGEDTSKRRRRIHAIDIDDEITLVSVQDDVKRFDVDGLNGEEVVARQSENVVEEVVDVDQVSNAATTATITTEEITLAKSIEALKIQKPKNKGKGFMIEEHMKPKKKDDQIRLDEEVAKRLQDEFNEKEILTRERVEKELEANIALIETWDDIQAKIDVDHQLAERMQAQEQEELSDKELVEGKGKRVGEELIQESTKKQKVDDDKETTELNQFMKVILDYEEVAIDAIPLAIKSPKIID
uniref:Uncharacterized protein n=1 Tax=Tanacetum cinerariifolium TaxID=118510 RepID=A0A6L2L2L9_TANCI|nr:hypothetical protein [Tanacetum cinerariifolium]